MPSSSIVRLLYLPRPLCAYCFFPLPQQLRLWHLSDHRIAQSIQSRIFCLFYEGSTCLNPEDEKHPPLCISYRLLSQLQTVYSLPSFFSSMYINIRVNLLVTSKKDNPLSKVFYFSATFINSPRIRFLRCFSC